MSRARFRSWHYDQARQMVPGLTELTFSGEVQETDKVSEDRKCQGHIQSQGLTNSMILEQRLKEDRA